MIVARSENRRGAPQVRRSHSTLLRGQVLLLAFALAACGPREGAPSAGDADGWHRFSGAWTATGRRTMMQFGSNRRVSVVDVSGSLLLSGPTRPSVGFQGSALTFADDLTGMLGRAVWTDDHGDQLFSE